MTAKRPTATRNRVVEFHKADADARRMWAVSYREPYELGPLPGAVDESRKWERQVEMRSGERSLRLWGVGYRRIAELARVPEVTVRQAVRRGQLDPSDLRQLLAWISERSERE